MTLMWAVTGLIALVASVIAAPEISKRRQWAALVLTLIFVCYLWISLKFPPPVDTRAIAIAIGAGATLLAAGNRRIKFQAHLPVALPLILILLSATWSAGQPSDVFTQALFMITLIVGSMIRVAERSLATALFMLFAFTLLSLAVALAVTPGEARLAGRLTGLAANPNTIGAIIALTYPAATRVAPRLIIPSSILALIVVWETGSRAALLAVLLGMLLISWPRIPVVVRPFAILISIVALYEFLPNILATAESTGAGSDSVLRSNNSRTRVWERSVGLIREQPWRGYGIGSSESQIESGSSLLSLAIVGGLIALAVTLVCLGLVLLQRTHEFGLRDWRVITLLAGLVNASFEGWLVASGSVFCIVFWLVASNKAAYVSGIARPENTA